MFTTGVPFRQTIQAVSLAISLDLLGKRGKEKLAHKLKSLIRKYFHEKVSSCSCTLSKSDSSRRLSTQWGHHWHCLTSHNTHLGRLWNWWMRIHYWRILIPTTVLFILSSKLLQKNMPSPQNERLIEPMTNEIVTWRVRVHSSLSLYCT